MVDVVDVGWVVAESVAAAFANCVAADVTPLLGMATPKTKNVASARAGEASVTAQSEAVALPFEEPRNERDDDRHCGFQTAG